MDQIELLELDGATLAKIMAETLATRMSRIVDSG